MSPIKGLTDRGMAFPEIGQIRKGAPKPENEKRPGKDLDYFRVEFDEMEVEAKAKFEAMYGTEPQEIMIWLPYAEKERCWDVWLEAYTAGQMVARSDGEYFVFLRDPKTGEVLVKDGKTEDGYPLRYTEGEPVGRYTDSKGNEQPIYCEPVGRLRVIVPALERLASLTLHTTSYYDIANISSNLEALEFVNNGDLRNIDILMKRKPQEISVPKGDGKRMRMTKWLISLEADPDWVKNLVNGRRKRAELENGAKLPELPESVVEGEFSEAHSTEAPRPEGERIRFTSAQLGMLVNKKKFPDIEEATAVMYRSILTGEEDEELLLRWADSYGSHRDLKKSPEEAAEAANKAYQTYLKREEK